MIQMYNEGARLKDIAAEMNRSASTIQKRIRELRDKGVVT